MASDPEVSAAIAKASSARGADYAGAIAGLGERVDKLIQEVGKLSTEVARLRRPST